jgi:tetratricopeptide (TPR) repeat protein
MPFLIIALTLLLPAPSAWAQADEEGEEDKASTYFASGRKLYSEGKYTEAIDELLKAYALRPAPPILLNVGRTYEKLGKPAKALEFYREFLLKARLVDPSRPQVEALVKQLEGGGTAGGATNGQGSATSQPGATSQPSLVGGGTTSQPAVGQENQTAPPTPPRARRAQLIHTPIDSAKLHRSISVMTELPPDVEKANVWLYFRRAGEGKFRRVKLEAQGDAFVGNVPARYVSTTSLQYYLAATDPADSNKILASAADKRNPNIIVVEGATMRDPNQKPKEIKSPFRTWLWVSGGTTAAMLGTSLAMTLLAQNRASAMEDLVKDGAIANAKCAGMCSFQGKPRDFESEGKTFAAVGQVMLALGVAAAGATAALWYLDYKHLKEKRRERDASKRPERRMVRVIAAPWANEKGAGLVGRMDF